MTELTIGVLVFDGYETLDAHGPIQFLGGRQDVKLYIISETCDPVVSRQKVKVLPDFTFQDSPHLDVILVPGGQGVRREVNNQILLQWLQKAYNSSEKPLKYLLSVCTGSWLLAKAGLLDGKKATSNKISWEGALATSDKPHWIKHARWVEDGNIITASGFAIQGKECLVRITVVGVSAGIDMTLFFISKIWGAEAAQNSAKYAEYNGQWTDPSDDPWS